jgi:hypothetical protein
VTAGRKVEGEGEKKKKNTWWSQSRPNLNSLIVADDLFLNLIFYGE